MRWYACSNLEAALHSSAQIGATLLKHTDILAGRYYFGNKPFINYLPRVWRDKLAPHVRVYSRQDLNKLFDGLPVKYVEHRIIFGAYDNLIIRFGLLGKLLRAVLQFLENTPLQVLGLSHFGVIEKNHRKGKFL